MWCVSRWDSPGWEEEARVECEKTAMVSNFGVSEGESKRLNVERPVSKHVSRKGLEAEVEIMQLRNNYAEIRPITYIGVAATRLMWRLRESQLLAHSERKPLDQLHGKSTYYIHGGRIRILHRPKSRVR